MGETDEDVIDVLMDLRSLGPDSIPINFLIPIAGTPLAGVHTLTPNQCLRQLSLARFLNPAAEIRIAGGREVHLRSMQAMGLYPANSIFVDGYLTEPGQKTADAHAMIADMGFTVVAGEAGNPMTAGVAGDGSAGGAHAGGRRRGGAGAAASQGRSRPGRGPGGSTCDPPSGGASSRPDCWRRLGGRRCGLRRRSGRAASRTASA